MPFDPHINLLSGIIQVPPTPALTGETFVLREGQGSRFEPDVPVTICHPAAEPTPDTAEIGYVADVAGDVLTIKRAQEGSSAQHVVAGWRISATITAKVLTDIEDAIETKADAESIPDISGKADTTYVDEQLTEVRVTAQAALEQETVSRVDADTELFTQIDEMTTALQTKVDQETGKGLSSNDFTTAEKTKLSGVAPGATQNASDNALRDRATHTGTQPVSTVTGLQTALDAKQTSLMINVRDYGATGDGVTDDTASIQAAVDAAAIGGGSVFVPRGTYLVNGTVNILSSVKLTGAGMDNGTTVVGTTFKRTTSTGSPMLSVTGGVPGSGDAVSTSPVKRVVFSDFTLRASGSSDTLLRMFYTNRNHVARVRFIGTTGHAVHGVEFWDTTFDACTFDFTGSASKASVFLQNRSTSTAVQIGYSNDNCNRLSFRSCTWESFTSRCIEMDGASNGSTHLMNNITIDDCKFETSTFERPFVQTGASVASVYIRDSYFASNAGSAPAPQIALGGSSASVKDCRFYQGAAGVVECAIKLDGHAGQNTVDSITCNWLGSAPTSGAAVVIGTPVTPSEDSISNVKANTGKKVVDATAYSSFRAAQSITATADQEPKLLLEQTGANPKKFVLGISPSGNLSLQPDIGALWTVKKPDGANFAVFDMSNGRLGVNNVNPSVTLDVTGEARVSVAGTTASSVVTVGGAQTLTNKSLTSPTLTGTPVVPATITANSFNVTFPGAATTIVGRSTVDTMSNKTLTSPKLTSGNAPATSTSPGAAGQVEWDANYFYVCIATNVWKRTALGTW